MVLEYCPGGDLAQAMAGRRHEPMEEPLAGALVRQLAAGRSCRRPVSGAGVMGNKFARKGKATPHLAILMKCLAFFCTCSGPPPTSTSCLCCPHVRRRVPVIKVWGGRRAAARGPSRLASFWQCGGAAGGRPGVGAQTGVGGFFFFFC